MSDPHKQNYDHVFKLSVVDQRTVQAARRQSEQGHHGRTVILNTEDNQEYAILVTNFGKHAVAFYVGNKEEFIVPNGLTHALVFKFSGRLECISGNLDEDASFAYILFASKKLN